MAFKAFDEIDIQPIKHSDIGTVSMSENSSDKNLIAFMTGIKSLGKTKFFDTSVPASFALSIQRETKYSWKFDKQPFTGTSITAERTVGTFLSTTATEDYESNTSTGSAITHQSLYNYTKGYLYRPDLDYDPSITGLFSANATGSNSIAVARVITIRKDLFKSAIQPNTLRMEMNLSQTSATGIVTGSATTLTTAMDLKNSSSNPIQKSFAGVKWESGSSLDNATTAMTIETIIRPYKSNSVILWRRLSSEGWAGSTVETQNSFIKLELTKSPDLTRDAFRFYILSSTANGDFANDFAKKDVQASGLFVPDRVGINLFDGKFHHIMVTWSTEGLNSGATVESGAGAIFGYIDGKKLLNEEQVDPRLNGGDAGGGPVVQANMFEQRIPLKTNNIQYGDSQDGTSSANNMYIGISNYRRITTDQTGDRGNLLEATDPNIGGGYDGQIQHLRIWDVRFSDGTTGIKDNINLDLDASSTASISFSNFHDATLTGGSLSTNMLAWWNFNELHTASANDLSTYSNTAQLIGTASINLYDEVDISRPTNFIEDEFVSLSGVKQKTYLYIDRPESKIINKEDSQGRIIRYGVDGKLRQIGTIFYDTGIIVLDNNDSDANLNFLYPASGTTGDFGFSVTANNYSAFNFERMVFNSVNNIGRLTLNVIANGDEYNYTENPSGINQETEESVLDEPATYPTTVGLYNDNGDLLAIGKFSVPINKSEALKITAKTILDF